MCQNPAEGFVLYHLGKLPRGNPDKYITFASSKVGNLTFQSIPFYSGYKYTEFYFCKEDFSTLPNTYLFILDLTSWQQVLLSAWLTKIKSSRRVCLSHPD